MERTLTRREAAVLAALRAAGGRVVARAELARAAGLDGLSERRVDGVLVALRRHLPEGALVTVRGRGWLLGDVATAPSPAPTRNDPETLESPSGNPRSLASAATTRTPRRTP